MHADRRQLTAFALLGLVMVLWAGNSIVGRAVRFDVPPLSLAFGRWLGASLTRGRYGRVPAPTGGVLLIGRRRSE